MRWLLIPFVALPVLEIYLLLFVGRSIGFWPTLAMTLMGGLLGGALVRRELRSVLHSWQRGDAHKPLPLAALDSALMLLAGGLLLSPGLLTDAVGLALLVRPVRHRASTIISERLWNKLAAGTWAPHPGFEPTRPPPRGRRPERLEIIDTEGESLETDSRSDQ